MCESQKLTSICSYKCRCVTLDDLPPQSCLCFCQWHNLDNLFFCSSGGRRPDANGEMWVGVFAVFWWWFKLSAKSQTQSAVVCLDSRSDLVVTGRFHSQPLLYLPDIKRKKLIWLIFFAVQKERWKGSCWWTFSFSSIQSWRPFLNGNTLCLTMKPWITWLISFEIVFALRF